MTTTLACALASFALAASKPNNNPKFQTTARECVRFIPEFASRNRRDTGVLQSPFARERPVSLIRKRERSHSIRHFAPKIAAAARGNHHELFARFLAHVGGRSCVSARLQIRYPELRSCLRIECSESAITRRTNKNK